MAWRNIREARGRSKAMLSDIFTHFEHPLCKKDGLLLQVVSVHPHTAAAAHDLHLPRIREVVDGPLFGIVRSRSGGQEKGTNVNDVQ